MSKSGPAGAAATLYFNGIDGTTGEYLRSPLPLGRLTAPAVFPEPVSRLRTARPVEGVDACDLAQTGWAVIFAPGTPPCVREALTELLRLRKDQASRQQEDFYRESTFGPGLSERCGIGPGAADSERFPYYVLLVGDPEAIPFDFQYQLDVQRAVGRLWFAHCDGYARYARSVVEAEARTTGRPRRALFFAPCHPGDPATRLTTEELAVPLAERLARSHPEWCIDSWLDGRAIRAGLLDLLARPDGPHLLFTAGHGVGFPREDSRQRPRQGALLCQDWPGPGRGPVEPEHYFGGDDIPASVPAGLISFHLACYSAGTPRDDTFGRILGTGPRQIAAADFVAALPQRLLAAGALAVIGHIDQAFHSYIWEGAGRQLQTFESTLSRLLRGFPVGAAMDFFGERYAEIATRIADELEPRDPGCESDPKTLGLLWLAHHDARGYILLGDPAVRLPTGVEMDGTHQEGEKER